MRISGGKETTVKTSSVSSVLCLGKQNSKPSAREDKCSTIWSSRVQHQPLHVYYCWLIPNQRKYHNSHHRRTWRRVWGDGKKFRGQKFLNDLFLGKIFHFDAENF